MSDEPKSASPASGAGSPPAETPAPRRGLAAPLLALAPLAVLAAFAIFLFRQELRKPGGVEFPPVEELVFERVVLVAGLDGHPEGFVVHVRNAGPDAVHVKQVQVDEAYYPFTMTPEDGELGRLGSGAIEIPYPWVEGEAHRVTIVTSTGVTFTHEIPVAVASPTVNPTTLGFFALIGLYVGIIPIGIGLAFLPALRRLPAAGWNFILFLTIGLLVFLGIDTVEEGLELTESQTVAGAFHPFVLFFVVAIGSGLLLQVASAKSRARTGPGGEAREKLTLAYMIALGIGLHNLGEGLAIGAAYNAGELALGAMLVVGFALHNTTEGFAIVAPMAREAIDWRRLLRHLVFLGLLSGGPAILGAWIGGFGRFTYWGIVFMAVGAGAIFQVVYEIAAQIVRRTRTPSRLFNWSNLLGFASGIAVMFATALLV